MFTGCGWQRDAHTDSVEFGWDDFLFYIIVNNISAIYVMAHKYAGGLIELLVFILNRALNVDTWAIF